MNENPTPTPVDVEVEAAYAAPQPDEQVDGVNPPTDGKQDKPRKVYGKVKFGDNEYEVLRKPSLVHQVGMRSTFRRKSFADFLGLALEMVEFTLQEEYSQFIDDYHVLLGESSEEEQFEALVKIAEDIQETVAEYETGRPKD